MRLSRLTRIIDDWFEAYSMASAPTNRVFLFYGK